METERNFDVLLYKTNMNYVHLEEMENAFAETLSKEEMETAQSVSSSEKKREILASRYVLRHILSGFLPFLPKNIPIETEKEGKPFIINSGGTNTSVSMHFNISHSGNVLLIAISKDQEVGVDVERKRKIRNLSDTAAYLYPDEEQSMLSRFPEEEKNNLFLQIWTRREAAVKCLGLSIAKESDTFRIKYANNSLTYPAIWNVRHKKKILYGRDLAIESGYFASLCRGGKMGRISVFKATPVPNTTDPLQLAFLQEISPR